MTSLKDRLEPEAFTNRTAFRDESIVSIAISLKRIADILTGDAQHLDIGNAIYNAITQGIAEATRRY